MTAPIVAVDHLTALDVGPPRFLALAAEAGYDAAGIRIRALDASEFMWDLSPGTLLRRETEAVIRDTGIRISACEVIRLRPGMTLDDLGPMLETAHALRAEYIYVITGDEELGWITDVFAEVSGHISQSGFRPLLEPMPYRRVDDVFTAREVVAGTSAGVLVDTLHFVRGGMLDRLDEWCRMPGDLFPLVQICDAPLEPPTEADRLAAGAGAEPKHGQSAHVNPLQWEARVGRLLPGDGAIPFGQILDPLERVQVIALEAPSPGVDDIDQVREFLATGRQRIARTLEDPAGADIGSAVVSERE